MEVCGQHHPQPLYCQERTPVPIEYEAIWPQSWSGPFGGKKDILLQTTIEPRTVQSSHCTDYVILDAENLFPLPGIRLYVMQVS
jgi:hypothetical protein